MGRQHYTRPDVPPPRSLRRPGVQATGASVRGRRRCSRRVAFALAFKLRFLDASGGIPDRYWTMLTARSPSSRSARRSCSSVLGLHGKWWRYFQLPDLWPVVRAAAVASGLLVAVFTLAKPYAYSLPRSIVVFDFLLTSSCSGAPAWRGAWSPSGPSERPAGAGPAAC